MWYPLLCSPTHTRARARTYKLECTVLSLFWENSIIALSETIGVLSCLLDNIRKLDESSRQETSQKDVDNPTSPLIKDHLGRQLGPCRDSRRCRCRRYCRYRLRLRRLRQRCRSNGFLC